MHSVHAGDIINRKLIFILSVKEVYKKSCVSVDCSSFFFSICFSYYSIYVRITAHKKNTIAHTVVILLRIVS